tara:strand:+ start:160 stop:453 length:294 start_codon:yes stop_codon:yes gene_type:complete
MNSNNLISDLENLIAETICLKIEKWNLYLGDAGLARKLAIECLSNISNTSMGIKNSVEIALESVQVSVGNGSEKIALSKFIIASQKQDLENILADFT